ncbi:bifunctional pyr operon transcriptional regulator/uracil phosphoribosyltransferase PyrR [Hutsoniella sourekii]|uniref:bifunctional pyr operon transcriptional regulator/uracil phosphoribosyltransferase PyrR n=1 Tax=Hutsoniella sourekii TaxID=87650 RepID=UPI0004813D11|nr:bifunctional pyr operon transcriptional regulator/uracil phosphoribosyltransferase PyrR [Hutsoniella sourekii]
MKVIMNAAEMSRALTRIAFEIVEHYKGIEDVVIVGIETRGKYLGQRLAEKIETIEGPVPFLALDTRPYRDDSDNKPEKILVDEQLQDKRVVLVDDVLYTGRTVRAAMDACLVHGRPASTTLAALVDRGHRELPIRADFIGKNIPTSASEHVKVQVAELDDQDAVLIS